MTSRPCLGPRPGVLCPDRALTHGTTRCQRCGARREQGRGTPSQRGYGYAHRQARLTLKAELPAYCAYGCGRWLTPASRWVAAHVVDGDPSAGYVAACVGCNERAKGGRRETGGMAGDVPAPTSPRETFA